jgi:hypothetical protein
MFPLSPTAAKYVHIAIGVITAVAGLGPLLAQVGGLVPAQWLTVASHVVAFCGALVLYLSQSPLLSPLLQMRPQVSLSRPLAACPQCGRVSLPTPKVTTP